MTDSNFSEKAWIKRFAAALDQVAIEAEPSYTPPPPVKPGIRPIGEHRSALNRGYRDLAARARYDPAASKQFEESHLRVRAYPAEAIIILKDHPLMQPGLEGAGENEGVRIRIVNRMHRPDLKWVIGCLAKLSVKEGGEEAARRWHHFLAAGANRTVPACEITVIHGLVVNTRFNLCAGAYLAPYGDARAEFGLPDEPEPFPKTNLPDAAVLVRTLEYGPAVVPPDDLTYPPDLQVTYRFPADYQVDLEDWWVDSKLLIDLLSIAKRVPLLSRTRYVRLARWIEEMDPNFAFGAQESGGFVSDMWPQGEDFSKDDLDAFLKLARGWRIYPDRSDAFNLAIRRLAASFSRPGGRFGKEDRVLDVAIALEVLYGGKTGHTLAQRAAALLGTNAEEQKLTYGRAKGFYDVRSGIVHWKRSPSPDTLDRELEIGQELACHTLANLLSRNTRLLWADVAKCLLPETQAHIAKARSKKTK